MPGNQFAGFDWRYQFGQNSLVPVLYRQLVGELETGGFSGRYPGQFGASTSRATRWRKSTVRAGIDYSDTTCKFYDSDSFADCAYNHGVYKVDYRHRGRSIGHSTENDSRQFSIIGSVVEESGNLWLAPLRVAGLYRAVLLTDGSLVTKVP